jgi:hypothetical protein
MALGGMFILGSFAIWLTPWPGFLKLKVLKNRVHLLVLYSRYLVFRLGVAGAISWIIRLESVLF